MHVHAHVHVEGCTARPRNAVAPTHVLDSVLVLTRRLQQRRGKARQGGDLRREMLQHRGARGARCTFAQALAQSTAIQAAAVAYGRINGAELATQRRLRTERAREMGSEREREGEKQ